MQMHWQKRLSIMSLLTASSFCTSLLQYPLQCVKLAYAVLLAPTMQCYYSLLQCATCFSTMCFCSVMIVQNGNWQMLQGCMDSSASIHHRDSYSGFKTRYISLWQLSCCSHSLVSYQSVHFANLHCFQDRFEWFIICKGLQRKKVFSSVAKRAMYCRPEILCVFMWSLHE